MSEDVLEKLKAGIRRFHEEVYTPKAEEYRLAASRPQRPHTLIVACADSRVDVESITSSGPGEVFVTRNVGNLVPPYSGTPGGVTAVIEYAVTALGVKHLVVCGHSDCGAMKALLKPHSTEDMPAVDHWLHHGRAALKIVESTARPAEGESEKLARLTEVNVLAQLVHMKTHPSVAGAWAGGQLTISGWVYDIASGTVRIARDGQRTFEPVTATAGIGA
ncbi:carbonic anhydrase [Occallatibacter riparius]|uniref:Carbonic anhydrase n=1 Tax=Occallatibacter riparius TaxID=1002689 RepID=A0A9J7BLU1_9BACT|nr:carbonic anhydrase [Occallatibacter riparius]UWZ83449.1 carbonic anhydrase [Occallatibacter riparius]